MSQTANHKTLSLKVKDIVQLHTEQRIFLNNKFSQYQKFKLNENLQTLRPLVEAYSEATKPLVDQYMELDPETGRKGIKEHVKNSEGVYVVNEKLQEYNDAMKPIEEEVREVSLRTIPSWILSKIEDDGNHYDLLFAHLIVEEAEPKPAK